MQPKPLSLGHDAFCICLPSCLIAVAGYVPGVRDSGLDGGGEATERDSSPMTLVFGLEWLSWRLP